MSRVGWAVLALLCAWAFITIVRRIAEARESEKFQDGEGGSGSKKTSLKDDLDWDELERAENEVRDLDPDAKPEDGFEGDDWGPGGPGTIRPPKPPVA